MRSKGNENNSYLSLRCIGYCNISCVVHLHTFTEPKTGYITRNELSSIAFIELPRLGQRSKCISVCFTLYSYAVRAVFPQCACWRSWNRPFFFFFEERLEVTLLWAGVSTNRFTMRFLGSDKAFKASSRCSAASGGPAA